MSGRGWSHPNQVAGQQSKLALAVSEDHRSGGSTNTYGGALHRGFRLDSTGHDSNAMSIKVPGKIVQFVNFHLLKIQTTSASKFTVAPGGTGEPLCQLSFPPFMPKVMEKLPKKN